MLLKLIGIQDLQRKHKILQCYQIDRWMSNIIAEIHNRRIMWIGPGKHTMAGNYRFVHRI
jgi:hypothetical protein